MVKLNPNERLDYMYDDNLKIIQDKTSFSFSLDTLLLAYWAKKKIHDRDRVADLCAGNCAASLYMAHFNCAYYDAVEILPEVADQARRSIALNHMENRITVHQANVRQAPNFLKKDHYDVVVVNPPYFKVPKGHKVNPDRKKAIARHEILINLKQIISVASGLLKMKGKLFLVHRPERLSEIVADCLAYDLSIKLIQPFVSHRGEHCNLVVVEAVRHTAAQGLTLADTIEVHAHDGHFLPAIQKVIRESPQEKKIRLASKKYYFYVLKCHDGSFYGGFTDDLKKRVRTHNLGKGAKYTRGRLPVQLIYHETFNKKELALKREYWFKHHQRKWKEKFLIAHKIEF